jgi:hypothetical protein
MFVFPLPPDPPPSEWKIAGFIFNNEKNGELIAKRPEFANYDRTRRLSAWVYSAQGEPTNIWTPESIRVVSVAGQGLMLLMAFGFGGTLSYLKRALAVPPDGESGHPPAENQKSHEGATGRCLAPLFRGDHAAQSQAYLLNAFAQRPANPISLQVKVALVSSADSALGRSVAISFARGGANVAMICHCEDQGVLEAAQEIEQLGRECFVIVGRLGGDFFYTELMRKVVDRLGHIDVLSII